MGQYSGVYTTRQQMQAVGATNWPPPSGPDPYFENVTLLLPGNGTNKSQNNTFLDSSPNNFTITRNGDTTQGSFSPYGDLWSNYFDGSGDSLSVANAAASLSQNNFTIEAWVFPSTAKQQSVAGSLTSTYSTGFEFVINSSGGIYFLAKQNNSTVINIATANGAVPVGVWTHVAVVKNSTTYTIYVNGVSSASGTGGTWTDQSDFWIGRLLGSTPLYDFNGYISNIRVVKGTAVYTANFTPPTAPLTAISGTSLLTCQSNRFLDASTNNFAITVNGNTSVTNFAPFNPTNAYSPTANGGSGYFDGTGDYLTLAYNTAFNVPGDFTIEAWVYQTARGANSQTVVNRSGISNVQYSSFELIVQANGTVAFLQGSGTGTSGSQIALISTAAIPLNAWTHIAGVKNGSTSTLYVNGVQAATGAAASNDGNTTSGIFIGTRSTTDLLFTGYINGVRLIKGTALYTSNFTPPTAPLTAITNTSLLLNFTNAGIVDAATKNNLTTISNAQISNGTAKFGSTSIEFDGNGDYLKMPTSPNFNFGTGDFTIEAWIYPVASATAASETYYPIVGSDASFSVGYTYNWLFLYVNQGGLNKFRLARKVSASPGGGSDVNLESSVVALNYNQWQHVAVTRSNGTVYFFSNGNAIGSVAYTGDISITQGLTVNAAFGGSNYQEVQWLPQGYTDNLRITKGIARYTTSFTPPTTAFPTYGGPIVPITATGGTITTPGDGYRYHTFTTSDTFTVTDLGNTGGIIQYLVVAGGGGGGSRHGGGGGAGGLLANQYNVTSTNYSIVIGAGGAGSIGSATPVVAAQGSNSSVFGSTVIGGGGGGSFNSARTAGGDGGSGGGGSLPASGTSAGGTGTAGQGNNGGAAAYSSTVQWAGGGGGGAGAIGQAVQTSPAKGGDGGIGLQWPSGSGVYYAGGGGGAAVDATGTPGTGGNGGGANGTAGDVPGINAPANKGGGGGGARNSSAGAINGGNGGSGIVIIRYPI